MVARLKARETRCEWRPDQPIFRPRDVGASREWGSGRRDVFLVPTRVGLLVPPELIGSSIFSALEVAVCLLTV